MALSVKVVEFTITASGSLAVTGVGFQPEVVILAATSGNSNAAASYSYSIGAATSSSARWAMGTFETDGGASSEASRVCKADRILSMPSADGSTVTNEADFTSMDSDGFTINVGTYGGATRYCAALCLAGTDLDVAVGTFQTGTTTGANRTAVSGLSFEPKAIFCASTAVATGPTSAARMMYGFASGSSNEWVSSGYVQDNIATMATSHAYKTDAYLYHGTAPSTVNIEIDFNTFNADGWDHNVTTAANDFLIGYVAFGGSAQFYVGNDAQKATAGTEPTTGVGFTPVALLTSMGLRTTSGSDLSTGDYYAHLGMMEAANEIGFSQFSDDGTADSEVARGYDSTHSLFAITDDATPTVPAQGKYSSFDSDGFTIDWVTADATARLFGFLAIGAASGGSLEVSATTDALTLAEYAATIGKSLNISATTDALTLAEHAATVGSAIDISATTDALALAEYAATIGLSLNVQATTDALTLAEYPASLGNTQNVQATTDALTLAEYPATLSFALNVSATTDALVLAEYAATISDGTAVAQNPSVGGGRPGRTYAYPSEPKKRRKAPDKPQETTSVPDETMKPYEVAGRLGAITEVPDNVVQLPVKPPVEVTGAPIEPVQKSLEELVNEAVKKAMAEYQAVQDGEKILKQLEKEEAELSLSEVESLLLLAMVE